MAVDDDDRYGSDMRDSPQRRSHHRSTPDVDMNGREGSPSDAREGRENGDRHREVKHVLSVFPTPPVALMYCVHAEFSGCVILPACGGLVG